MEVSPASDRDVVFAIVVDVSGSNADKVEYLRKYVLDVFDVVMTAPSAKGYLLTFGDTIVDGKGWLNRTEFERAIQGIKIKQGAPSPMYSAVTKVANELGKVNVASRRLLFLISDGMDTSGHADAKQAINTCLTNGVTVIPMGLLSTGREKAGAATLTALANSTGGLALLFDHPGNVKEQLANLLKSEYILSFTPASSGLHRIKIAVLPAVKDTTVSAPIGYYAR